MTMNTHPALPEFEYVRPGNLVEASEFLSRNPDTARPFLGGTDVFVRMRDGVIKPKFLVDLKNLDGMQELRFDPQAGLTIGAAVNMNQVIASPLVQAYYPLLAEACRSVASYQLRTRATIVGNICNASPAGDTIGASLVLGGVLHIQGTAGTRRQPLAGFFLGPGKTILKPGDIVTAIQFPIPPAGCAGRYIKLGRNQLSDLSIIGVTAFGYKDQACPSGYRFRLALASVAPVPLVPTEVEAYLANNAIAPETIQAAARMAAEACSPIDDVRSGARYRRQMIKNTTARALTEVWKHLG